MALTEPPPDFIISGPPKDDTGLLREAVAALRDRVHMPADRTCCPDCADDADAAELIARLQERLLGEGHA